MSWKLTAERLAAVEFVDHRGAQKIALSPDLFRLELEGGTGLAIERNGPGGETRGRNGWREIRRPFKGPGGARAGN